MKKNKRLQQYLGGDILPLSGPVKVNNKNDIKKLKEEFANTEYGKFINSLTPQQKKTYFKLKNEQEQQKFKVQTDFDNYKENLKNEELKRQAEEKAQEEDMKAYKEGRIDEIKNTQFRSDAQIERANKQGEENIRQNMIEQAKSNDNIVNGLWDAVLNVVPYVGLAKQALGIRVGGSLEKFKNNIKNETKKNIKGGGILQDVVDKVANFIVKNGYNTKSKNTIKQYGGWKIFKINIYRKPIESYLRKTLDIISLKGFSEGMKNSKYEDMFHLGCFCILGNNQGSFVNVLCEKNAVVEISRTTFNINSFGENIPVYVNKNITLYEFLKNGENAMGNNYFKYDPFNRFGGNGTNCQGFVKMLLQSNGFLTPEIDEFVFQPLDEIVKRIGEHTGAFAKAITTLGAVADNVKDKVKNLFGGDLVIHRVNVNKNLPFEQALKHARNILKTKRKFKEKVVGNSYHFRNIPKTHFKPRSWKSKKINDDITIVFGELKPEYKK
jgi:hypothetical protein